MGNPDVPAGWYPDPAGSPRERWWDGTGWTGRLRDPGTSPGAAVPTSAASSRPSTVTDAHTVRWSGRPSEAGPADPAPDDAPDPRPSAPPRPRGALLVVLVALIVGGAGISFGIWLADRDPEDSGTLAEGAQAEPDEQSGEESVAEQEVVDDAEVAAPEDVDDPSDEQAPAPDPSAPAESEPAEAAPDPPAPSGSDLLQVSFDGVCDVWLTRDELATQLVRPWQFPGECPSAPVSLEGVSERWIVVVASLNGNDFRFDEALARATESGLHGQVLWSSHYSSLNPDLWVVYDGPFPDRGSAATAAQRRGGSSYPRVLSDDTGDRYCADVVDNCAGERRN